MCYVRYSCLFGIDIMLKILILSFKICCDGPRNNLLFKKNLIYSNFCSNFLLVLKDLMKVAQRFIFNGQTKIRYRSCLTFPVPNLHHRQTPPKPSCPRDAQPSVCHVPPIPGRPRREKTNGPRPL